MASSTLALLAPGAMGAALAARLSAAGASPVLTNLDGRSEATVERARAASMQHASYAEIAARATCVYSVVPPDEAFAVAEAIVGAYKTIGSRRALVFVDCNAVNPDSAKRIATLFEGTGITFLDGAIIGLPPTDTFYPGIYVCADPKDVTVLDEFTVMSTKYGMNIIPLKGEGAGIGDASALKMAHAGIVKGMLGLCATMILGRCTNTCINIAANAASPSTADGLIHALDISSHTFVDLIISLVPQMLPKTYRFVGEMNEIAGFVGEDVGAGASTFQGLAETFARIASAHGQSPQGEEIAQLLKFVEEARKTRR